MSQTAQNDWTSHKKLSMVEHFTNSSEWLNIPETAWIWLNISQTAQHGWTSHKQLSMIEHPTNSLNMSENLTNSSAWLYISQNSSAWLNISQTAWALLNISQTAWAWLDISQKAWHDWTSQTAQLDWTSHKQLSMTEHPTNSSAYSRFKEILKIKISPISYVCIKNSDQTSGKEDNSSQSPTLFMSTWQPLTVFPFLHCETLWSM